MIPVLSDSYPMTGNGLGGLSDAISCTVTNEINGEYELRMRYPVTGIHYAEMLINYIIMATPGILASAEPFRIYRITRPLNGVVTVYARHLSYDMSGIVIEPCTASSLTQALTTIPSHAVPSCPFTLASTRTVASAITVKEPKTLWSLLGGSAGSFLDVYGGEWEFTGYTANLKTQLGTNRGVEIRYGKNLTQLDVDADISSTYGGVYPFWYSDEDGLATMTGGYVSIPGSIYSRILLLDCSDDFDTKPSSADLQTAAQNYITNNSVGSPKDSWKVSFALLAQSKEYETQAILEQVQLGDTVKVKYAELGVDASARAVKTEWDVLGDKYVSITLGRVKQNLASILVGQNRETERAIATTKSALEQAIAHSTDFIKNGTGVMRFIYNSSGDLMEIVSLDNADISQAQSVWRWNNGGFGHSSTGYNGAYTTAITQNGAIVADFITTGTLNAARVKAGILSDALNKNSWNLDTGAFTLTNGSINITTSSLSEDKIELYYGTSGIKISPLGITGVNNGLANLILAGMNGTMQLGGGNMMGQISVMDQNGNAKTRIYPSGLEAYDASNHKLIDIDSDDGAIWLFDTSGTSRAFIRNTGNVGVKASGSSNWNAQLLPDKLYFQNNNGDALFSYPNYGLYAQDIASANIADQSKCVQGSISGSGADTTATTRLRSTFISVEPNTTYDCGVNSQLLFYEADFYNGAYTWLSNYQINATTGTFTTPSGCWFLKCLVRKSDNSDITPSELTGLYVRKKSALTGYKPYEMSNAKLTEIVGSRTYESSSTWTSTTNWSKTPLSITMNRGWWVICATQSYSNAAPYGVELVYEVGSNKLVVAKTEVGTTLYADSGYDRATTVSHVAYVVSSETLYVYARANTSGATNTIYLRAKRIADID